jgi:hypothetical protein
MLIKYVKFQTYRAADKTPEKAEDLRRQRSRACGDETHTTPQSSLNTLEHDLIPYAVFADDTPLEFSLLALQGHVEEETLDDAGVYPCCHLNTTHAQFYNEEIDIASACNNKIWGITLPDSILL